MTMQQGRETVAWPVERVLVFGATGFVGQNLVRALERRGSRPIGAHRSDCDLLDQAEVRRYLRDVRPTVVFHAAGLVGGIMANKMRPGDFCYENLLMGTMLLHEAHAAGARKFVGLIGACSYPQHAPNPIREDELFKGYPQPESAPYGLAKAMTFVQAQAYRQQHGFDAIVVAPGNLYGPGDNFHPTNSHVIPALLRKFQTALEENAREVVAWGTGAPVRDFIYVEDACDGIVRAAECYSGPDLINISSGVPTTIRELVETVAEVVGYQGAVVWDTSKPDGQMFKGIDVTRMREWLAFEPRTTLREGIAKTHAWFMSHREALAER